jgi:MFS family permease
MARPATTPLRYPEFRNLWAASIVSNLGSLLQTVAATWLMLQLTGSALWVGLMVAAPTLPLLVVAMPAGAMADLVERRHVVLVCHAAMALIAALIAALHLGGLLTPGLLLALGLALGTAMSINLPSWQAMVPDLVPNGHVASAVALNSASFNVARAVGPALGGVIVATAGPGPAFLANACSYLFVVAVLLRLPKRRMAGDAESMSTAIALGLRYARFTPAFRWLLLVAACFGVTSAVVQAALPNYTSDVLGAGAGTYGILLGAMGAGALVGAFTRPASAARLGRWMVPGSICAFGFAGVALGLFQTLPTAVAAMLIAGVLWVWILSTLNATTQLLSPQWVRGRIMSLYTLAFLGFLPLGSVLAGLVADLTNPAFALVALSSLTILLGAAVSRFPLPILEQVVTPTLPLDYQRPPHVTGVEGGPVMILTTWVIDEDALADFLAAMDDLRRVRLRTGAYRWRLYRNAGEPHRMTEMFLLHSWEAHLRQHERMDVPGANIVEYARTFDVDGGPITRHLAAIDVIHPEQRPDWDALVAIHDEMHRADGALPLPSHEDAARDDATRDDATRDDATRDDATRTH